MDWYEIAGIWRSELAKQLKDKYGLPEEEADKKTEAWFNWLQTQSNLEVSASAVRPRRAQPLKSRRA
jgi:hypothetical protein